MTDVPSHLHHELNLKPTDIVQVHLSSRAKVYLMTTEQYRRFLDWEPFEAFGGDYEHSPARLRAPTEGLWHLAVQQIDETVSLTIRVEVVGQTAPEGKRASTKRSGTPVEWDLSNPNHCVLVVDKTRKFLTRAEMNAFIHRIVRGKNELARRKLVYAWLQSERNDILVEAGIDDFRSPVLAEMIRLIRERLPPGSG